MALMRSMLLAASQNRWLREHAVNYPFVRRSVSRFMPGETVDAALIAAKTLARMNIDAIFTHLGENVADATRRTVSPDITFRSSSRSTSSGCRPKYP